MLVEVYHWAVPELFRLVCLKARALLAQKTCLLEQRQGIGNLRQSRLV
jgi:hypothetical protein